MISAILFFLTLFVYAVFSYGLVDPNLVLSTNTTYWNFQQWMWQTFYNNSELTGYVYLGIVIILYVLFFNILQKLKKKKIIPKSVLKNKYFWWFIVLIFPLFFSYNMLSHDVFNYLFYTRMIVKYGVDSKTHVALEFPNDLWTRFMHNTHVTDVYGRGWTLSTIVPYLLGLGKLSLTLVTYRIWNILGMLLLYFSMQYFSKALFFRKLSVYESALVFLNPHLLIETVSNYHNDLMMMPFALYAVAMIVKPITHKITDKKIKLKYIISSLLLLTISVSIKYATIALLPIWALVIFVFLFSYRLTGKLSEKFKLLFNSDLIDKFILTFLSKFTSYVPDFAALLMFVLLLTPRSKFFLPWYTAWIIVWVPFMKNKTFRNFILVLSLSSALRYLPWIFNNFEYGDLVYRNEVLITWSLPVIYLFTNLRRKLNFEKN